jgi:hypothetical protein
MTERVVVLLDYEPGSVGVSDDLHARGYRVICVANSPRAAAGAVHIPAYERIEELAPAVRCRGEANSWASTPSRRIRNSGNKLSDGLGRRRSQTITKAGTSGRCGVA